MNDIYHLTEEHLIEICKIIQNCEKLNLKKTTEKSLFNEFIKNNYPHTRTNPQLFSHFKYLELFHKNEGNIDLCIREGKVGRIKFENNLRKEFKENNIVINGIKAENCHLLTIKNFYGYSNKGFKFKHLK